MDRLENRMERLEERQDGVQSSLQELCQDVRDLDQRFEARFNSLDQKTNHIYLAIIGVTGGGMVTIAAAIIVSAFFG